jgi:hypothetical protein
MRRPRRTAADVERIREEVRASHARPPSAEPPRNLMAMAPAQPVCVVSYRDANGIEWVHNTQASSVFAACERALAWFAESRGRAIPPADDTVLTVSTGLDGQTWSVRARRVREWMRTRGTQEPLFDKRPEAL